jgi:CRP/FNR family transcriptional regulator
LERVVRKPTVLLVDDDLLLRQVAQAWRSDEVLFREGDVADAVFVVVSGTVRTNTMLPDARRQIFGFYDAGDVIGVTLGEHYLYSAESVSSSKIHRVRRVEFEALFDAQPHLSRSLALFTERELEVAQRNMVMLGRMTARERLSSFLFDRLDGGAGLVNLPMSRLDIADYLGLTIETVSRTMTRLRVDGIIRTPTRDSIEVIDLDRLKIGLNQQFAF